MESYPRQYGLVLMGLPQVQEDTVALSGRGLRVNVLVSINIICLQ